MKRTILISCSCLLASLFLLWASDPGIGDWPMWGGTPDRNMVSKMKGLPTSWDVKSGKNVKWIGQLGSQSYGNPVVAGGQVYVGTNNELLRNPKEGGDRGVLMCFRESDGKFVLASRGVVSTRASSAPGAPGHARFPLSAIYLLNSAEQADGEDVVTRRLLRPTLAVPALMQHLKLGPVVRREDPARLVKQLGEIASAVPVFELSVARDWSVVDDVVERVIAWHTHVNVPASQLISA